jgi:hypothetical protein
VAKRIGPEGGARGSPLTVETSVVVIVASGGLAVLRPRPGGAGLWPARLRSTLETGGGPVPLAARERLRWGSRLLLPGPRVVPA